MHKYFILLCFCTTLSFSHAQDSTYKNMLQVNWGVGTLSRQDLIISPFIHSDVSFSNIGISYYRNGKFWQDASLNLRNYQTIHGDSFEYYSLDSVLQSTYPNYHTFVHLQYALGKEIHESNGLKWLAGGNFESEVDASSLNYGSMGSFAYFATFSLGLWGEMQYSISEKHQFHAKLSLPLIAWVARSPYLLNDDMFIENTYSHKSINTFFAYLNDGNFATWNTLQTFNVNLRYGYTITSKWQIGVGYNFYFVNYSEPIRLASFDNLLSIAVNYKF